MLNDYSIFNEKLPDGTYKNKAFSDLRILYSKESIVKLLNTIS